MVKDAHGQDVLHVRDPHALIQASGYLKFIRGPNAESIFFRGQSETYPILSPTLFRGISTKQSAQSRRVTELKECMADIVDRSSIFSAFRSFAHEPLLQHYGISTTWLDLVDNIWIALWFSAHKARVSGKPAQYLHFERRDPKTEEFAFILLIATDSSPSGVPGLHKGPETELVDLRVAAPSIFLRPHAQHGVLFRKRGKGETRPIDYSSQIRGIIRMELSDALLWLGEAKTLSTHALFPPPYYDHGYKMLLNQRVANDGGVGTILIVGA